MSDAVVYPGAIDTWIDYEAKKDKVKAEHIRKLQNAVEAIELELGIDVAGSVVDLVTRLSKILSLTGALRNGTSFPGSTEKALMFFKSDEDTVYVRNNADTQWITIGTAGTSGFLMGAYASGHGGTITWNTEIYDIGSNTTTTTFTAPVTGKYLLTFSFDFARGGSAGSSDKTVTGNIVTSNRTYSQSQTIDGSIPVDHRQGFCLAVVADMDAGDTAYCTTSLSEGASNVDYTNEIFSGIRIG